MAQALEQAKKSFPNTYLMVSDTYGRLTSCVRRV